MNRRREKDALAKELVRKRKQTWIEVWSLDLACCCENGGEEERRGGASVLRSVEERVELTGEFIVTGVEAVGTKKTKSLDLRT